MQRIPSGVVDQYIYFVAVDSTDFTTPETGLSSFTVRRSRNGGASAAFTTPTINETDSSNMPGWYELLMDEDTTIDSGDVCQVMALHITATGMAPARVLVELFRPDVTAGETLTVSSGIGSANVTQFGGSNGTFASGRPEVNTSHISGSAVSTSSAQIGVNVINAAGTAWGSGAITAASIASGAITNAKFASGAIDATSIASAAFTSAKFATGAFTSTTFAAGALDAVWSTTTRLLTAGTNIVLAKGTGITGFNDPTAATTASAVRTELTTELGRIDTTISSRLASSTTGSGFTAIPWNASWDTEVQSEVEDGLAAYDAATGTDVSGISIPSAGSIADAVWDEALAGHVSAGSAGAFLDATDDLPSAAEIADAVWDEDVTLHQTADSTGETLLDGVGGGGGGGDPAEIADAVLDEIVEGTTTLRQSIKIHNAVLAGKASGMNTETATFRSLDDSQNVITATVDQYGNRLSVSRNV